jgi:NADPH-dependent 2,4-dienoyl-CoA reductase/sulfur reductase-like enzyme/nitrite reductase/ring-hydroxylating ferredoxin subunit
MEQREHRLSDAATMAAETMRQVEVGDEKILIIRTAEGFSAIGAECTHYGAPLVEGVLSEGRVVCPWHHACFAVRSGAMLEPPGLDAQRTYPVRVDGDDLVLTLGDETPAEPSPPASHTADTRVFVIVGAGAAGTAAAELLRAEGFRGRIVLLSDEPTLPYDRTLLSKSYLAKGEDMGWIPMRDEQAYADLAIELRLGAAVERLQPAERRVELKGGETLRYDALLLATGSSPIPLKANNADLKGVYTLRSLADAERILAALRGAKRAVLVGASFIAMECASSLRERGLEVTVVAPEAEPFERILGGEVGKQFRELHVAHGVQFRLGSKIASLEGEDSVRAAVLDNGEQLPADLVIVGVGVRPTTPTLVGVEPEKDGGLPVDAELRVVGTDGSLFAAGDIAAFPDPRSGERVRVEHWRVAMQQGRVAALGMLGRATRFTQVPLFWSLQHGTGCYYVGHAPQWDELIVHGSLPGSELLVYYLKDEQLLAALGAGKNREMAAIEECMRRGRVPEAAALRANRVDWPALLVT